MKVSTLACILGAWTEKKNATRALDIGTGTGLLALMQAQKHPDLYIDAVEIDAEASIQASENMDRSPWNDRIRIFNKDISDFATHCDHKYDLIISNPPFFKNQQPSPDERINLARHSGKLDLQQLTLIAASLLRDNGSFFIILPPEELDRISEYLNASGLYIKKRLDVLNVPKKPLKAVAVECIRKKGLLTKEVITIRTSNGVLSDQYKELLRPFYLHL